MREATEERTENSVPDRFQETEGTTKGTLQNGVKCLGILPGIGFYAHSSDDSSNSDSSDSDLTEMIGTVHPLKKGH